MADINVGAIAEALNNKVDLPTPSTPQDAVDYVVEKQDPTSANGYTWYRKYADGWVEQGGNKLSGTSSYILPITMANTNYYVNCSYAEDDSYCIAVKIVKTSSSQISVTGRTTVGGLKNDWIGTWMVIGQAAA